jgi:hypothetical protein
MRYLPIDLLLFFPFQRTISGTRIPPSVKKALPPKNGQVSVPSLLGVIFESIPPLSDINTTNVFSSNPVFLIFRVFCLKSNPYFLSWRYIPGPCGRSNLCKFYAQNRQAHPLFLDKANRQQSLKNIERRGYL